MYRRLLVPVLVLFLASVACSLTNGQRTAPTESAPPPAQQVVEAATATEPPVPPTEEPPVPTEVPVEAPTEEPTLEPVEAPTEEPAGPQPFAEPFDEANKPGWKYVFIAGTERNSDVYVDEGMLKFEINPKETYAYVYNENETYSDMLVTATVENKGDNENAMAVACRMSDLGWYEMRITSMSHIVLYRYDQVKKDRKQVPYVTLMPDHIIKQINPGFKENEIALGCVGNEIHMYVNGTEMLYEGEVITDDTYSEGYAGVGAMSFTTSSYGVKVYFDEMRVDIP